jgi:5-methylcytosine-specific restriction endonuclease McrA
MNLLDKAIVLRVNSAWQALGVSTVKDAITAMNSGDEFIKAAIGIDIQYQQLEDGSWDFENPNPVPTPWEKWIHLPIREFDQVIRTASRVIRVPTVIAAINYSKIPKKSKKPTKKNIRERDGNRCQITGRLLDKDEGNIDHAFPRSRGGGNSWDNLIYMDKKLNTQKGARTLEEMGWTPLRAPSAPPIVPVSATIRELRHRDWKIFLKHLE